MKQCLIVDDSRVVRKVARKILEGMNFTIDEAEDGVGALEICRRKMPDAILVDWNMPTMSGIEFLRVLRREPSGANPIVVFCTSEHDLAQITEAMEAGANEYITKPFDKELMEATFAQAGLT
jgi:two-component system chemotaxis response regulator CheY